jgi:hypothetical protein
MSPHDLTEARRHRIEARILATLAKDGAVLDGTLDALSHRFGLAPAALRASLLMLAYAGDISIHSQPGGRLTIQSEHRRST